MTWTIRIFEWKAAPESDNTSLNPHNIDPVVVLDLMQDAQAFRHLAPCKRLDIFSNRRTLIWSAVDGNPGLQLLIVFASKKATSPVQGCVCL